jgi:dTDP-4-amino-4,6-dideoxygalactose transaminase
MLALFGGQPTNQRTLVWNSLIGEEEKRAVMEVLDSKVLSDFYGSPGDRCLGGKKVKELDRRWAEYFGCRYAISMNSATSCLFAAVAALGIGPGDEVIVAPLTMSASVVCVLGCNAIPVFADLEPNLFCIDPIAVEKLVTPRTKAIVAVDLFGQPANLAHLREIATRHNLTIIEDCAQAPGATFNGHYAGTLGDIGVFSLNCHKAIQCGEGGIAVTNSEDLALRLQLIRNHAEAVVEGLGYPDLANMIGQNYRLTEIQAAIALEQLPKLQGITQYKRDMAALLDEQLSEFPFLTTPTTRANCSHVYYLYVLKYDAAVLGIHRNTFVKALNAEGYNASFGYVKPIYLLPLFQQKTAYAGGCPFTCTDAGRNVTYPRGLCPISEQLHFNELFYPNVIRYKITAEDVKTLGAAIAKVASYSNQLQEYERRQSESV